MEKYRIALTEAEEARILETILDHLTAGARAPAAHRQPFLAIEPLRLLAVDDDAVPAKQDMQAAIAEPPTLLRQLAQPRPQVAIIRSARAIPYRSYQVHNVRVRRAGRQFRHGKTIRMTDDPAKKWLRNLMAEADFWWATLSKTIDLK